MKLLSFRPNTYKKLLKRFKKFAKPKLKWCKRGPKHQIFKTTHILLRLDLNSISYELLKMLQTS